MDSSRVTSSRASARPITSRPLSSARPITSTGLMAPRTARGTARSGLRRQVQDKTYFIGLLRSKINELNTEIAKLSKEIDIMTNEELKSGVYKRKAEALAKELAHMTKELMIYNEYNGRLLMGEDDNEIREDIEALKRENVTLVQRLEANYEKKKQSEEQLNNHTNELHQIKDQWDNLRRQFTHEDKERYDSMERVNQELSKQCEDMETQIKIYREKKNQIEMNSDSGDSLIRREILQAMDKLRDLEKQRDDLTGGANDGGDERGRLLAQVKRDNREIATMEAKINVINEQIQETKGELEAYEDIGATEKYKELKKKEETIEAFLSDFETNKNDEIKKMEIIGAEINDSTEKLSRCLNHIETLKGTSGYGSNSKERSNSGKSSKEELHDEKRKLELDLNKIEQLEEKINSELDSLRSKINTLQSDIITYSDIPKLKAQIDEKIENHESEKQQLIETSAEIGKINDEFKINMNKLKENVDKHEVNKKIKSLEERLSDILSVNESLKLSISSGMNVNLKAKVMDDIKKYNQRLLGY